MLADNGSSAKLLNACQIQPKVFKAGRTVFAKQTPQINRLDGVNRPSSPRSLGSVVETSQSSGCAPPPLSHLTSTGEAHMVDISQKLPTRRSAAGVAFVLFSNHNPYTSLTDRTLPKGDAIAVARIAGIQATKKTAELIPLAHPGLGITGVKVDIELLEPAATSQKKDRDSDFHTWKADLEFGGVKIIAHVSCDGKTGVEMEALTAANVAALTIYDMCKVVDKYMLITGVRVIKKTGGKNGDWDLGA